MPSLSAAPVRRVELFEDRATVHRRVDVPQEPGSYTLRVGPLTPLVRTTGLALLPSEGLVVEDVQVHRRQRHQHDVDDAEVTALRNTLDAARDQLARHRASIQRLEQRALRCTAAVEAARAWTPRALLEESDLGAWVDALRNLEEQAVAAQLAEVAAHQESQLLEAEVKRCSANLDNARRGTLVHEAWLELQVVVQAKASLSLRYTVPCALWRPVHEATLDDERVSWEVGAMAWNHTGEDWRDVELVCSTARPGGQADPPQLEDDILYTRRRDAQIVVEERDETVHAAREGSVEKRSVDVAPGVDDGGEPRTYTAPSPVSLPSTGRPVRFALARWKAEAEQVWRCHPEKSALVVLETRQPNQGLQPLLAGPVSLFRDSGAVGRGQIGLVPPGEPFRLGWGSHDGVRVTRRQDQQSKRTRLTGYQTRQFDVELKVSHMGDEPVTIEVRERIPVSEIKEVTVSSPSAEPALDDGPDKDGYCVWRLALQPGDRRELRLSYAVEAPSHVVLPF